MLNFRFSVGNTTAVLSSTRSTFAVPTTNIARFVRRSIHSQWVLIFGNMRYADYRNQRDTNLVTSKTVRFGPDCVRMILFRTNYSKSAPNILDVRFCGGPSVRSLNDTFARSRNIYAPGAFGTTMNYLFAKLLHRYCYKFFFPTTRLG